LRVFELCTRAGATRAIALELQMAEASMFDCKGGVWRNGA